MGSRNQNRGGSTPAQGGRSTLQDGLRSQGLNTLTALIKQADLVGVLSGNPTLFAPTDAALATFVNSLPAPPDAGTVKIVLINHVDKTTRSMTTSISAKPDPG